jgi:hypothetical protein
MSQRFGIWMPRCGSLASSAAPEEERAPETTSALLPVREAPARVVGCVIMFQVRLRVVEGQRVNCQPKIEVLKSLVSDVYDWLHIQNSK